jgi:glycosyltransferase involved in cell wall biosynthesis
MRIVSTGYNKVEEFSDPVEWLNSISFYTGVFDELARQHEVISIERISYEGVYRQNGVQYYFVDLKRRLVHFPRRLHRFIKQQSPDIVLVHGFIFPLQVIQLRRALGKKVRIIVQNHAEKPYPGIRCFLQRIADRYIDAYLFTSKQMGKEWIDKRVISKEAKIAEVVEVSTPFRCVDKKQNAAPVFIWVGRLNANKDPLTVVKAFIRFLSVTPAARLYMIYQTEDLLREIKELIDSSGKAREAIELAGNIPHEQLQPWYEKADFFISGSHFESGGVALCEAMACGCIPIVTDILSFRKMTGSGHCGLLYEPGNEKALFQSLVRAVAMDIEKERAKVLQQFNEELSFAAIAGKINKVINSL